MNKTKFAVKVHNEFLSKAIQELAFKNGVFWRGDDKERVSNDFGSYSLNTVCIGIEDGEMGYSPIGYYSGEGFKVYDAKTDWDAIEQAMKVKEPRVIWVSFNSSGEIFDAKKQNGLLHGVPPNGSIVKFQEVIE